MSPNAVFMLIVEPSRPEKHIFSISAQRTLYIYTLLNTFQTEVILAVHPGIMNTLTTWNAE